METEHILLLYDNETALQKVIAESSMWKISVLNRNPDEFFSSGANESVAGNVVCAMHYQAQTMLSLLNQLRTKFPTAGIVFLTGERITGPTRGLLLLSGADACFDDETLSVEIIATIQALRRRGCAFLQNTSNTQHAGNVPETRRTVPEASESAADPWQLRNDGWSLLTPRGHSVALTRNERYIMQKLFDRFPKAVGRDDLLDEQDMSERHISLLISRMKRKTKLIGEDLPVRSIRGQGYVFLGASSERGR